ncbi:uncharacterized protein LOC126850156 [Cataglyphis hispanica]|uniref:uncharacterized protein LOC126850156 n=1 Tax=Cataglyphis hispanica TaxID=1086592 RepID=UPI00217FE772|nr:uncharacterized protein LOC126850156 [Cataglyphis hispanica]
MNMNFLMKILESYKNINNVTENNIYRKYIYIFPNRYNKKNSYDHLYDEPCAKRNASNTGLSKYEIIIYKYMAYLYYFIMYYFTILANSDFQRFIIRKILDIGFQLRSLQEQGNVMNSRLDTILRNLQISSSHWTEGETNMQDVMNNFPIDNIEDLRTFEKLLIENQINRQKLIKELSRIGGNDIKRIIFNLLRALISDKLACLFNYIGKKKQIFYDLEIRKYSVSVVRVHFMNATEQIIAEPIKSWLRHANERFQKKIKDNTDRPATSSSTA